MATDKKDTKETQNGANESSGAAPGASASSDASSADAAQNATTEIKPPITDADTRKDQKDKPCPVLRIRAKGDRFRRCGMTFTREESVVDINTLSEADVAALLAEPALTVIEDVR